MIRFWQSLCFVTFVGGALFIVGCREKAQTNTSATTAASPAAASSSPGAMVASSPVVLASPVDPTKALPLPQAASGAPKGLDAIPERLRRPLSLEEINALPPETRDMILKAQGRLPAAPTANAAPAKK